MPYQPVSLILYQSLNDTLPAYVSDALPVCIADALPVFVRLSCPISLSVMPYQSENLLICVIEAYQSASVMP